ncbi:hypothetical protein DFH28DRAFT_936360 [Melampsora americana]|nr:hypothetical protein DFH28DRAFT_936360 [Melampsora americana]
MPKVWTRPRSVGEFLGRTLHSSHHLPLGHDGPIWQGSWAHPKDDNLFEAHPNGFDAVTWAPVVPTGSLPSPSLTQMSPSGAKNNAATGRRDRFVKIWGHTQLMHDLAYSSNIGLSCTYLASAGQDPLVNAWTIDGRKSPWVQHTLHHSKSGSQPTGAHQQFGSQVLFGDLVGVWVVKTWQFL